MARQVSSNYIVRFVAVLVTAMVLPLFSAVTAHAAACTITGAGVINGTSGPDVICGSAGRDTINGLGGDDIIYGDAGNDVLTPGPGNDSVDGGAGIDQITYADAAAAVTVDLGGAAPQSTGGSDNDTLSSIEQVTGTPYGDVLTGDTGANAFYSGAGDDILSGGDGDDGFVPGAGDDSVNGGMGTDIVSYYYATVGVSVNLGTAAAQPTGEGSDTLSSIESAVGSSNNDSLTGDGGNNMLAGSAGNDTIVGGGGTDTVNYYNATSAGVTVNLATTTPQNTGGSGSDTLSSLENVIGSPYNDSLTGNGGANVLSAGPGNDTIDGNNGADTILPGDGTNTVNGSGGSDQVSYADLSTGVDLNMNTGKVGHGASTDTLSKLENATGTAFDDTITGTKNGNVIYGLGGNDTISGLSGSDTLYGGGASECFQCNTLDGGSGPDVCYGAYFNTTCETVLP